MFAISTAWNFNNQPDARQMLSEIKELGFDAIEISHHATAEKLEDIIGLVKSFGIKVVSVHNFCPLPPIPQIKRHPSDYYRLSSLDEAERRTAVEYTKRTVDTAKRVSAQAVVIHAGTVELEGKNSGRLFDLFREGKVNSDAYNDIKQEFLKVRAGKEEPHFESAVRSLQEMLPYAVKSSIKIGIENRYYPEEIPNFEETKKLLDIFKDQGLYYWHDIGHAEVNERLGITSHSAALEQFSGYMLGMHIHDIRGLDDHLAPFSGEFDFSGIAPYLSEKVIRVIEVNSHATSAEIRKALVKLGGDRGRSIICRDNEVILRSNLFAWKATHSFELLLFGGLLTVC